MSTKSSHSPALAGAGFTSGPVSASIPIDHTSRLETYSDQHYHEFSCPTTRMCHANRFDDTAPNRYGDSGLSEGKAMVHDGCPDQRQRLHRAGGDDSGVK